MGQANDRDGDEDPQQPDEERLNRELAELTSELRVVIPGATVLLAFLLTVPFASGFPRLSQGNQGVFFLAFISTAVAVVLLLAEGAHHRIRGKPYDKGLLIKTATRQMVAALALLGVALVSVVFLVTDVLFGPWASVPVSTAVFVLLVANWFGLPLLRRWRSDADDRDER